MKDRNRPALVIMAAGMGSRYGGLKQLDSVGPEGELLINYTLYDAYLSGFERVVFVIRHEFEEEFKERITKHMPKELIADYAYQDLSDLPPERKKPWGTGHAVLVCEDVIHGPFGVVNADDFYGRSSFLELYKFLESNECNEKTYCMVGYRLKNTVSPHGGVTRGLCRVTDSGWLDKIDETRGIEVRDGKIGVTRDEGWTELSPDTATSMNFWGFDPGMFKHLKKRFESFIDSESENPKAEFLIPDVVGSFVAEGFADVKVLSTDEVWFGMTHPEDKEVVKSEIKRMIGEGVYPKRLK
jgi:NDP-sugar pyrophosphorylase family protein